MNKKWGGLHSPDSVLSIPFKNVIGINVLAISTTLQAIRDLLKHDDWRFTHMIGLACLWRTTGPGPKRNLGDDGEIGELGERLGWTMPPRRMRILLGVPSSWWEWKTSGPKPKRDGVPGSLWWGKTTGPWPMCNGPLKGEITSLLEEF